MKHAAVVAVTVAAVTFALRLVLPLLAGLDLLLVDRMLDGTPARLVLSGALLATGFVLAIVVALAVTPCAIVRTLKTRKGFREFGERAPDAFPWLPFIVVLLLAGPLLTVAAGLLPLPPSWTGGVVSAATGFHVVVSAYAAGAFVVACVWWVATMSLPVFGTVASIVVLVLVAWWREVPRELPRLWLRAESVATRIESIDRGADPLAEALRTGDLLVRSSVSEVVRVRREDAAACRASFDPRAGARAAASEVALALLSSMGAPASVFGDAVTATCLEPRDDPPAHLVRAARNMARFRVDACPPGDVGVTRILTRTLAHPPSEPFAEECLSDVGRLVCGASVAHQAIAALRAEGMSWADVARALGLPEAQVRAAFDALAGRLDASSAPACVAVPVVHER